MDVVAPAEGIEVALDAVAVEVKQLFRDQSESDDLVQDTLMKAIGKIDQFEPGTRPRSWLFTIMRNTSYNRSIVLRREAPRRGGLRRFDPGYTCDAGMVGARGRTEHAMKRMLPKQREILIMVTVAGASYIEAAEQIGCDIGTVKSRLFRSRARLLQELGADTVISALI